MLRLLLLAVLAMLEVSGQVIRQGPCPNLTPVPELNLDKYMGTWYEQIHSRRWTGLELKCSLEYFDTSQPKSFRINSFTYSPVANRTFHIRGEAAFKSSKSSDGNLSVKIPSMKIDGEVMILGTDYSSYTVMWSCVNVEKLHFENVVVMTREPIPKGATIGQAVRVLVKHRIQRSHLQYTTHRHCPLIDPAALSRGHHHHHHGSKQSFPSMKLKPIHRGRHHKIHHEHTHLEGHTENHVVHHSPAHLEHHQMDERVHNEHHKIHPENDKEHHNEHKQIPLTEEHNAKKEHEQKEQHKMLSEPIHSEKQEKHESIHNKHEEKKEPTHKEHEEKKEPIHSDNQEGKEAPLTEKKEPIHNEHQERKEAHSNEKKEPIHNEHQERKEAPPNVKKGPVHSEHEEKKEHHENQDKKEHLLTVEAPKHHEPLLEHNKSTLEEKHEKVHTLKANAHPSPGAPMRTKSPDATIAESVGLKHKNISTKKAQEEHVEGAPTAGKSAGAMTQHDLTQLEAAHETSGISGSVIATGSASSALTPAKLH